ncbi:copper homeostasis protein CutC [Tenacibaculum sp. M341]|uniref:copper homeostasis protein CutC n=1 Tax=Tenacibaculum sp. M341 TaxID=2530339 RepID=UPI001049B6C7|nr:copper homeostasis protein CutC [Tenacibaculum sp. M341]TCI94179.1 copper homeostasis protein CutC [Tenacibaculum sp. M341]
MKLEICTNSYQSALNAQLAGADRIELCSELSIGGITPSYGLLKQVAENLSITTFVLIRPRSGNFMYSNTEFEIMKQNIELCKKLGLHGIVSGILNADNSIDVNRTKELIELAKPLPFTFHRAFDITPNPYTAIEQLIELGVETVLTSGQKSNAADGILLLKELQEKYGNKITILAGSGINITNVHLFKDAKITTIHSSASTVQKQEQSDYFGNIPQRISDINIIQQLLTQIQS